MGAPRGTSEHARPTLIVCPHALPGVPSSERYQVMPSSQLISVTTVRLGMLTRPLKRVESTCLQVCSDLVATAFPPSWAPRLPRRIRQLLDLRVMVHSVSP